MSQAHHAPHSDVRTEADTAKARPILIVSLIAVLVFAVSVFVVAGILQYEEGELGGVSQVVPKEVRQYEVGIVNQPLFEGDLRMEHNRASARARLSSYGWVDKEKQLIHIPVEKAMEQLVSEEGKR